MGPVCDVTSVWCDGHMPAMHTIQRCRLNRTDVSAPGGCGGTGCTDESPCDTAACGRSARRCDAAEHQHVSRAFRQNSIPQVLTQLAVFLGLRPPYWRPTRQDNVQALQHADAQFVCIQRLAFLRSIAENTICALSRPMQLGSMRALRGLGSMAAPAATSSHHGASPSIGVCSCWALLDGGGHS